MNAPSKTTIFGSLCAISYSATILAYMVQPIILRDQDRPKPQDYRTIFQIDDQNQPVVVRPNQAPKATHLTAISESDWCVPCQKLEPVLAELKKEGYNIEVLTRKGYSMKQGKKAEVKALPTLVFENETQITNTLTGFQTKEVIKSLLTK